MSWLERRGLTVYLVGVAGLLPGLPGCGSSSTESSSTESSSTEDAAASADRVFVSQAGSSTVLAIDAASGEPLARIDVGMLPHELVLSPDQRTLYVSLVGSQAIAEVDTASLRVRRTLLTAPVPERRVEDDSVIQAHFDEDAFSATTCYGCHYPGGAEPKYAGDRPFGLLLSPDAQKLYVTHLRESRLSVLDLDRGELESTTSLEPAGAATEVVAIDRLGEDELWVALRAIQPSKEPGALRRLDAATFEPIAELPTGADPAALLAMRERGSMLVSNFESNTVTIHSVSHDGALSSSKIEAAPGPYGLLALDADRVLSLDYYSDGVSFLNVAAGTAETLTLESIGAPYANPTHAALSSDGKRAWIVTSGTDGHLLALDLESRRVTRDLPIDGLSFDVAVVSGASP
ncbi:MAG: hypothetical protein M3020_11785 [Myxococcota bacterium]|nr:hypothetical protein [Myxococcota bacterium]